MGLIDEIIAESKEEKLDGYYKYVDPKVKSRTFDRNLTVAGFVRHKDPNTMYRSSKDYAPEHTKAHEFEHTQQLKSGRDNEIREAGHPVHRYRLSQLLYPFFPKVGKNDPIYQDNTPDEYGRIHFSNKEFLADLSGLFRMHQDPTTRQDIEDILKSKPEEYKQIQKNLYPTMNHMQSSDTSVEPTNPPMSMIDLARQWIRNKTAY